MLIGAVGVEQKDLLARAAATLAGDPGIRRNERPQRCRYRRTASRFHAAPQVVERDAVKEGRAVDDLAVRGGASPRRSCCQRPAVVGDAVTVPDHDHGVTVGTHRAHGDRPEALTGHEPGAERRQHLVDEALTAVVLASRRRVSLDAPDHVRCEQLVIVVVPSLARRRTRAAPVGGSSRSRRYCRSWCDSRTSPAARAHHTCKRHFSFTCERKVAVVRSGHHAAPARRGGPGERGRRRGQVEGKVAFITGAARGQGRSHAVVSPRKVPTSSPSTSARARSPPDVPLATPEDLEQTVAMVEALGRRIIARQADVRDLRH